MYSKTSKAHPGGILVCGAKGKWLTWQMSAIHMAWVTGG